MRETVGIAAGDLAAFIVPSLGGALARFDLIRDGASLPLFRSWPEAGTDDPGQLASIVLIPWSNRISGGGFSFGGRFYPLAANFAGEPLPIHGNGWTSPWSVTASGSAHAVLELVSEGPGPYRYRAVLDYALEPHGLTMGVSVTNLAATPLPYGTGFHPWLPRTADTLLSAPAASVWLEDSRHLPTGSVPVSTREDWDFSLPQTLPRGWVNNGFAGWNHRAAIEWRDRGLTLDIEASDRLNSYVLYSPGRDADFFCFEPVSHVVDAHNLPGGAAANGLAVLSPGEGLLASCRFTLRTRPPATRHSQAHRELAVRLTPLPIGRRAGGRTSRP